MANAEAGSGDVRTQLQAALFGNLVDKIRQDRYPSVTMMDAAEANISDEEQLRDYAEVLLEKFEGDQFPSVDLMRRLEKLT